MKHVHLELATAAFLLFQVPTGITVVPYDSAQVEESEDSCAYLATMHAVGNSIGKQFVGVTNGRDGHLACF